MPDKPSILSRLANADRTSVAGWLGAFAAGLGGFAYVLPDGAKGKIYLVAAATGVAAFASVLGGKSAPDKDKAILTKDFDGLDRNQPITPASILDDNPPPTHKKDPPGDAAPPLGLTDVYSISYRKRP